MIVIKYPKDSKCMKCGKAADLRPAGNIQQLWICYECSEKQHQQYAEKKDGDK